MPNWVYNSVVITADAEAGGTIKDVDKLVDQVAKPYTIKTRDYTSGELSEHTVEEPFSFWNIARPEGEGLEKYEESLGTGGAMPYWYDWNCENWGSKWDASDVDFHDYGPDRKQYRFSTPWSPPISVLEKLSDQHPNLHIELEWEEEQGFGGTIVFRNGDFEETESYDVPSCHADYVERDREDQCICSWEDADNRFSDCPGYVAPPTADMLINDDLEVEAVS